MRADGPAPVFGAERLARVDDQCELVPVAEPAEPVTIAPPSPVVICLFG